MTWQTLDVIDDEGLRTIRLNRPEVMNSVNRQMLADLKDCLEDSTSSGVRCLLLTGAGRAFCAGRDLSEAEPGEDAETIISREITPVLEALWEWPRPTIAAVNGPAMGVGLGLALNCDVVLAADNAKLSSPFANLGVALDSGGHYHLPRLVGLHRAFEMIYTARVIRGAEAAEWGLVNRSVAGSRLLDIAHEMGRAIAEGPTLAFEGQKSLLRRAELSSWRAVNESEAALQGRLTSTADYAEGIAAFHEKRKPKFAGI